MKSLDLCYQILDLIKSLYISDIKWIGKSRKIYIIYKYKGFKQKKTASLTLIGSIVTKILKKIQWKYNIFCKNVVEWE